MERNINKIKRLEHGLGRWHKRAIDAAEKNEEPQRALARTDAGNQETWVPMDAVPTVMVLEHGEWVMGPDVSETAPGRWLAVPFFSVKRMRGKYEVHARRGEDGRYTPGVMEWKFSLQACTDRQPIG